MSINSIGPNEPMPLASAVNAPNAGDDPIDVAIFEEAAKSEQSSNETAILKDITPPDIFSAEGMKDNIEQFMFLEQIKNEVEKENEETDTAFDHPGAGDEEIPVPDPSVPVMPEIDPDPSVPMAPSNNPSIP